MIRRKISRFRFKSLISRKMEPKRSSTTIYVFYRKYSWAWKEEN